MLRSLSEILLTNGTGLIARNSRAAEFHQALPHLSHGVLPGVLRPVELKQRDGQDPGGEELQQYLGDTQEQRPAPDALARAALKVQAMLANPAERNALLKALELGAEQGIPLSETSPGVYTANFPATVAEGVYKLGFRVAATAPGNGAFTRIYDTDFYVPVVPDPKASIATVSTTTITTGCTAPGGCFAYTLKPTDAKGNLVGPGKESIFALTKSTGQLRGPVKDNLDGTYTIEVSYPTRDTKPPVLQIGGTAIPLPSVSRGHLKWWLLLLILLVVITFLILRRNRA